MNTEVIKLYGAKKYDEALQTALSISAFAQAEGVADDERVLPAISNAADLYAAKGKESEAITIYNQVLGIYEKKNQTAKKEE